jgi:16S rRNA (adenine1518-N6/adenine1519-N6)-dimethyltransferase
LRRPLGQHFLFDRNILKKTVDCSRITPDDCVIEIGAGLGTLTAQLALRARKVIAIEVDRRLVQKLKTSVKETPNVEVIEADALKYPFDSVGETFKVVANIPYYITTPLLFRLLEYKERIPSMTILMQKEIARRIVASPGGKDYGVLSIAVQLSTKPTLEFTVPRGAFSPPPEVDSAVVFFEVFTSPRFAINDEQFFLKVVKTAFSMRRKTIANSLKLFPGIQEALQQTGIDPKLRPEKLGIEKFIRLAEALQAVQSDQKASMKQQ